MAVNRQPEAQLGEDDEMEVPSTTAEQGKGRRKRNTAQMPPMKERLYSSYYRFRYGWSFNSSIQVGPTGIWLLGKCYHPEPVGQDYSEGAPLHVLQFLEHFRSLPWMTYRSGFPPIAATSTTSDCGWGCMIRSGQMLLAATLHFHLLGREWRLNVSDVHGHTVHRQILSWFGDSSLQLHPFSLHRIMEEATSHGYQVGDWFGPSQVAMLLRACVQRALKEHINLQKLNMYVAQDCTVYVGDVLDVFDSDTSQSLLVLVPVRLGSESLNPIYIPCIMSLLSLDHSVGIIGGKPKHSVYFVGHQDDSLIHLDPHYLQSAIDMTQTDFDISSYHCKSPRKIQASKMDPSCTLGFYCHDLEDFNRFRAAAEKVLAPPLQHDHYPFFTFCEKRQCEILTPEICIAESDFKRTPSIDNISDNFLVVDCLADSEPP